MGGVDYLFLSLGHSFASLEYDLSRGPVLPAMLKMISTNLQIFGWEIAYNDSRCLQKLLSPSLRSFPYSPATHFQLQIGNRFLNSVMATSAETPNSAKYLTEIVYCDQNSPSSALLGTECIRM